MFKSLEGFFDKLEDKVRARLSHRSIFYAFIGGLAHVVFWRGIWHTSDFIMSNNWHLDAPRNFWGWFFYEPFTIIWSSILLLLTGLFVATFIGERVIISGLKNEKKITEKTEEEVRIEEIKIQRLEEKVDKLTEVITEIKNVVSK